MEQFQVSNRRPASSSALSDAEAQAIIDARLAARLWESENATMRLNVPLRILQEHCSTQTRWVVLTGATCAGKSTTAHELEKRGYTIIREVPRAFMESEVAKGRSMAQVRADDPWLRQKVFELTLQTEISLLSRAHELIFLDRSAVDGISFHRASGLDPHEILAQLSTYRYQSVFHFTKLPFEDDKLRTYCPDRREFIDAALLRDYRALGYRPVIVPYDTVEARADLVLEHCLGRTGPEMH